MAGLSSLLRSKLGGGSSSRSETTSFLYKPLEDNSIRIVHLQPRRSKGRADKIECTLSHATFGEMPQYDALSYAWGHGTVKKSILLNGIGFEVGENLAAALINIRGLESAGEKPRKLWIDAVCINQSDTAERNHQVRLMPHIYARAQLVLVWLGPRSTFKIHCAEEENHDSDLPKHRMTNGVNHGSIETPVLKNLCRRQYWKRLWIIQEIAKATSLRIYYHSTTTEWGRFIENIKSHSELADSIPLRLESQLRGPFDDGLTLSNLLRANRNALCKDPRDKIYGLLGLAIDGDDSFPIDYSKSLFEVYKDTVFHQNSDETRSQHDILEISRLVARLLGEPTGLERDRPAEGFDAGDVSLESRHAHVGRLRVPGRLVGRIKHIGPLHFDMMAKIEESNEWRALVIRNIPNLGLRAAVLEQSDLFLKALERFDEKSQTTTFAFDRQIKWKGLQQYSIENLTLKHGSNVGTDAPPSAEPSLNGCRLFLLQPLTLEPTVSWMGLAPYGTQVGDFICHIPGIERAVIVRQSSDGSPASATSHYTYEIIGCAGLARNRDTARQVMGAALSSSELFDTGELSAPAESELFNLYMDIYTAYDIS